MKRPPSLLETYVAMMAPVAALLVLPVTFAVLMTGAMLMWVVGRWGSM